MFVTAPASTSAWVIVYVAVNVVSSHAPGARSIGPPDTAASGSATVTPVSVTLPTLHTLNV